MKIPPSYRVFSSLLLTGLLLTTSYGQKKLPLSTQSSDAQKYYHEAVQGIESFQPSPKLQALARQSVQADSTFAMGQLLLASLTPAKDRQPVLDKARQLAAKASRGERLYIEATSHALGNNREKAIVLFTKLHRDYPGERRICMVLGQLHQQLARYSEAVKYYDAALKIDDNSPRAYTLLGDCHLLQEQYARARECYQLAISKLAADASPFAPFSGLALTSLYERKPEQALETIQEFHRRYRRNGSAENFPDVWIWNYMGRVNLEFGRLEEALQCYETGYRSVPGSALDSIEKKIWFGRLFHGKARTLAKMGRHAEAWQYADQIKMMIQTGGPRGEEFWKAYHYLAGYLALESGDSKRAVEHLEQSDQEDPFQKLLLARAHLQLGNKSRALELCRDIVKNTTNNLDRALAYPEAKRILTTTGNS
ncbi:MAG: tetratricopeptide repeat protein [candidate division KSB1 bacterium]|nr:tetratricopeptide repeat protein [candidate division KSB1 bacterium]MDZ7274009.1 tetratricopeptide repeat protein [candidate division KSB1 bacterium]MDZ7286382.1 tetratricopeptide repeat protein [candidate division KSB1 bacterium]MDZ7296610.1 tetratricopeptide repeat protein [candidate division KSB1 bacterium]MDZ7347476.1 tetratricopeptide repeat protein [candidate division KSB1 bacterium]